MVSISKDDGGCLWSRGLFMGWYCGGGDCDDGGGCVIMLVVVGAAVLVVVVVVWCSCRCGGVGVM